MLRAIFFDLNGVLVDDEALHFELFRRILAEEGIELEEDEYYQSYIGLNDRACFDAILLSRGAPSDPLRLMRLVARKASYYREAVREQGYRFFPGARRLVREARQAGLVLGLVTGALASEVQEALEHGGLENEFEVVVAAEDVGSGKPDPEGYMVALSRLNAQSPTLGRLFHPHEIVAIEDTPAGLTAARAAGLAVVAVAHSFPAAALEGAEWVAGAIGEIDLAELRALSPEEG